MQVEVQAIGSAGKDASAWPACAMLSHGTFGKQTPAGRRYHLRAGMALGAVAVLWIALALVVKHSPSTRWLAILSLSPGIAFSYIAWEFRRYLLSLDELARRIQFEAIAWTYLTGMAIAALAGGVVMAYGLHWDVMWMNPLWFVLLEPVRSCFLFYVARRYSCFTWRGDTNEERLAGAGAAELAAGGPGGETRRLPPDGERHRNRRLKPLSESPFYIWEQGRSPCE